jgi:hypothetical protein
MRGMTADLALPLVVDLDGTLHADDLSWLTFVKVVKASPARLVPGLWRWWRRGKADMKCWLAEGVEIDPAHLRWHLDVIEFLRSEHERGRELYLATGTPQKMAMACHRHLGQIFRDVLSTSERVNMIGRNKVQTLISRFGDQRFDYLGNSRQDLQVWPHAANVYVANPSRGVVDGIQALGLDISRQLRGITAN